MAAVSRLRGWAAGSRLLGWVGNGCGAADLVRQPLGRLRGQEEGQCGSAERAWQPVGGEDAGVEEETRRPVLQPGFTTSAQKDSA
jgi:hypothetical protein